MSSHLFISFLFISSDVLARYIKCSILFKNALVAFIDEPYSGGIERYYPKLPVISALPNNAVASFKQFPQIQLEPADIDLT